MTGVDGKSIVWATVRAKWVELLISLVIMMAVAMFIIAKVRTAAAKAGQDEISTSVSVSDDASTSAPAAGPSTQGVPYYEVVAMGYFVSLQPVGMGIGYHVFSYIDAEGVLHSKLIEENGSEIRLEPPRPLKSGDWFTIRLYHPVTESDLQSYVIRHSDRPGDAPHP